MTKTTTNNLATRDAILGSAPKRRFTETTFAGQTFRIRSVTAGEFAEHQAAQFNQQGKFSRNSVVTGNARWMVLGCVDADGNQLFTNRDVPEIQNLDAGLVGSVALAIIEFSDLEDEAAKNSPDGDGSPTD